MTTRKMFLGRRILFAVIGERAAVHFWLEPNWYDHDRSWGGVEFHERPREGRTPDNEHCWLLGGPCCHDGSSLYASETVIPMFHQCCEMADYEPVWRELESVLSRRTPETLTARD